MKPSFPEVLDSTMLNSFRTCPKQFYYSFVRNKRFPGESVHLVAGAAFAKGLETTRRFYYDLGALQEEALARGLGALVQSYGDLEPSEKYKNKSLLRMMGALEAYFDQYPLDGEIRPWVMGGKNCIEFTFAIPIEVLHPDTGNPLILAGRTDMIGERDGYPWIIDEKTSGQLGPLWPRQWVLRAQFLQYAWACREHGLNVAGAIIRGIGLYQTSYGFAEAIITFADWKLDRWWEQTLRDIRRMIKSYKEDYFDLNLGDSCNHFGGCAFFELCTKQNPEQWIEVPAYFEDHVWNPLVKEKVK